MAEFERIGKYQIVSELGEGAMGVVYKAHDPVLNRFVAIKMISSNVKADAELRERFQREAQAAASLNHQNIITIHDFGEEHGRIYMAMELLVGTDLKEVIGSPSLRRLDDKLAVMEQMVDGLAFAHSKDIVHRDLKPGNIHIQPNGQVKLLDFGLARLGSSDITKTGLVMGTPNYMSPEQVMGERVDARSDIFSIGAVFYELITNRKPFEADSVHGVMFRVVHKEPPPVRQWVPTTPSIVVQLIERCLNKDRAQRFQNGGELRSALTQVRQALSGGRIEDATLIVAGDLEVVDEEDGEVLPAPPGGVERRRRAEGSTAGDGPEAAEAPPADKAARPRPPRPGRPSRPQPDDETRAPSRPPAAPHPSRTPLYVTAGVLITALVVGGTVWTMRQPQPVATGPDRSQEQLGALTEALVASQIQLAHRDLDDKEYATAAAEAERVLKLSPGNRDARTILDEARSVQRSVEEAAAAARAAVDAGDTGKASEELAKILALDPRHPSATELSARLNTFFQTRAEEARDAMQRSRADADKARAQANPAYHQGAASLRDADALLAKGQFALATRSFLESRDAFDKARRAALAPPPAAVSTADRTSVAPAPAQTLAPATLPPATLAPLPANAPAEEPRAAVPAGPQRAFVAGRTVVLGQAAKSGPAGFDTGGMEVRHAADVAGTLAFEVSPPSPRPGERFSVKVLLQNEGKKPVRAKSVTASAVVNGSRAALPATLAGGDVRPGQKGTVAQIAGTWPEQAATWTLDVTVAADRGEYKSQLAWR